MDSSGLGFRVDSLGSGCRLEKPRSWNMREGGSSVMGFPKLYLKGSGRRMLPQLCGFGVPQSEHSLGYTLNLKPNALIARGKP